MEDKKKRIDLKQIDLKQMADAAGKAAAGVAQNVGKAAVVVAIKQRLLLRNPNRQFSMPLIRMEMAKLTSKMLLSWD